MRLLILGGSGNVGSMVIPALRPAYSVRVLDLVEPKFECDDFVQGSLLDEAVLTRSVSGMDAIIYSVMGEYEVACANRNLATVANNHDLSVKGLHLALHAAHEAGIRKAIFLSTFNVYKDYLRGVVSGEDVPAATDEIYGFTKLLGESVCKMFGDFHGMTTIAFRLYAPRPDAKWRDAAARGHIRCLAASDLTEAIRCALRFEQSGYHLFSISGDHEEKKIGMRHAREVLGWSPQARV
jgi:nucleoside-diphosphate-sugar epimerase